MIFNCITHTLFTGIADRIAKQVQRTNDVLEARREAITKERARRPRKVKSRPTSPTTWKHSSISPNASPSRDPNTEDSDEEIKQLGADSIECIDTDTVAQTAEVKGTTPNQSTVVQFKPPKILQYRKKSIQLPLRRSDHAIHEDRKICKLTPDKNNIIVNESEKSETCSPKNSSKRTQLIN